MRVFSIQRFFQRVLMVGMGTTMLLAAGLSVEGQQTENAAPAPAPTLAPAPVTEEKATPAPDAAPEASSAPAAPAEDKPKPAASPVGQPAIKKTEGTASTGKPVKERLAGRGESYEGKVVVIKIGEEDLMNPARFEFMSRALKRATEESAEAVLIDLDTPGGLAMNTTTMTMEDLQKTKVPTISFVNPRALSAGALIAMGTDVIYMSPASTIGAATPVSSMGTELGEAERAKTNSALMAMARSAAKAKGHREEVANSMVDKDVGLKIGDQEIIPKGQICSLDQEQATRMFDGKPLLAKAVAEDLEAVKRAEGLRGETVVAEPQGFELLAVWITQYAWILLLIGMAAGYLEMQAPGFGLPGIVSAIAFSLFFFGHHVAGSLVGYEIVALFVFGVILIALEFLVFPGTVVPGLVGLLLVMGALIYTMAGWEFTVPEGGVVPVRLADYTRPLVNLALAFLGAIVAILVLMRFLPDVGPFRHMVLQTAVGGEQASIEGEGQRHAASIAAGATGTTRTALRPYGNVEFNEVILEAMSEGDYLPPGTAVRVRSVNSGKVVVEKIRN